MTAAVHVIDASALGALLFGEPAGEGVAERLTGARLIAPSLLPYELASICLKKLALYPARREALLAALRLADDMAIELVDVAAADLVELAGQSGLTAYDAAYLWLARLLDGTLVTLDHQLATAARALGVATA